MNASTMFFLLLVLACPLMMMLMMRGGHGHGGGHTAHRGFQGGHEHVNEAEAESTQELRRRRDELDRLIEEGERSDRKRELESATSRRRRVSPRPGPCRRTGVSAAPRVEQPAEHESHHQGGGK
jgi:hypothetical protein